jgi:transcriptional regulator with GAF, ATPase, and Fis domain
MSSSFYTHPRTNPELRSLYEISLLPPQAQLQEYFLGVMATLSDVFPIDYAALILQDSKKSVLHLEALYGVERKKHPLQGPSAKGTIGQVLQSRSPGVIQDIYQEPFYGEARMDEQSLDKIHPPILCTPLIADGETIGVININPLYGSRNDFTEDFHFLSILSAILSPAIQHYHPKREEPLARSQNLKTALLEEILEERLIEVLNRVDPYVESKSRTGLLADIVSLVEKILIKSAMEKVGYVQTSAARLLGINRNTLRAKMKELKIKFR